MLSISPVIKLLKAPNSRLKKWFRQVGNDWSYSKIDPNNVPTPVAWVVPKRDRVESSSENSDTIVVMFDVIIAVDRPVLRDDDEADDYLLSYRHEVYRRLRGQRLAAGLTPIKYRGGDILRVTSKDIVWSDTYEFKGDFDAYLDNPPNFESVDYKGVTP